MQISAPFFAVWRQRLEDGGIIHHQHVGIGHEQLEAGHAFAHHVVHVFEAGLAQIGDDHVQPVVDARPCPRPSSTRCRARRACACRAPGWRNRRWWWCRRTPPRACRFRNRPLEVVPPNGMSRCVCASMPPGSTYIPAASMHGRSPAPPECPARDCRWMRLAFDQNVGRRMCRRR